MPNLCVLCGGSYSSVLYFYKKYWINTDSISYTHNMSAKSKEKADKIPKGFPDLLKPDRFSVFFLYPFQFEPSRKIKSMFLNKKFTDESYCWKEHYSQPHKLSLDYNEYHYFYKYIQKSFFPEQTNKNINALKLQKSTNNTLDINYTIHLFDDNEQAKTKIYAYSIKDIYLYLFDTTGIGFLIFHIEDKSKDTVRTYLKFTNAARRLYPPYFDENDEIHLEKQNETVHANCAHNKEYPVKIEIGKLAAQNFGYQATIENSILRGLLPDFEYSHILDDRMFALCYYQFSKDNVSKKFLDLLDDYFSGINKTDHAEQINALQLYYQMLFVDPDFPMCPNMAEMKTLIDTATYKRWTSYHSIYGFSRYSCVFITTDDKNLIYNHFKTMYFKMAVILFFYKGMLLKFLNSYAEISDLIIKKKHSGAITEMIEKLKREFIEFKGSYWYKEITHQDQGTEMYALWEKQMGVNRLLDDVEDTIEQIYTYQDHHTEQEMNKGLSRITWIGYILLPLSIIASLWGLQNFKDWIAGILPYAGNLLHFFTVLGVFYGVILLTPPICKLFGKLLKGIGKLPMVILKIFTKPANSISKLPKSKGKP